VTAPKRLRDGFILDPAVQQFPAPFELSDDDEDEFLFVGKNGEDFTAPKTTGRRRPRPDEVA
jgi:hypothetical protein